MRELLEEGLGGLTSRPLLLLALLALPLVLVAWRWRTYPRGALVGIAIVPAALTPLLALVSQAWPAVAALDAAVALAALVDFASLRRSPHFSVQRQIQRVASLRQRHEVHLTLSHRGSHPQLIWLRDGIPDEFDAEPSEFFLSIPSQSRVTLRYDLRASRRGAFRWDTVHVRIRSRWGLWMRFFTLHAPAEVYVYPDVRQLAEYELLARTNRLSLMGVRRTRKIGQEHDFERLRDYTRDDNYKHIDWRSTARRQRLTVKEFQTSQSQRLIFMIDCGRMMVNQVGQLSLLDYALNAMLMLSYVALRRGDAVGLLTFSDQVHSYVPPRGGARQMNQLLHASFDRFPRLVESRYDEAFLHLGTRCRKRSLVILMTNLVDDVNARQVEQYLSAQVGRHLPMSVLLRDRQLFAPLEQVPRQPELLYQAAAAAEIVTWRHQLLVDLAHRGVLWLDVFPEDLTAPLINRYLEIKARNLL